jgi:hypothetical protein
LVAPRLAKWYATLAPTMPPPTMTISTSEGIPWLTSAPAVFEFATELTQFVKS